MNKDVLAAVLTKEQTEAGLYLNEPDDHIVELKHGNKVIARFTCNATVEFI